MVTRSKRSSATGSHSEPSRTSTRTSLRAALKAVTASARGFTSVATTSSAWAERWSAWTPQPVPRSRARPTGSRRVSWASEVDAGLTPRTWSGETRIGCPSRPGVRSLTTHQSWSSSAYGRQSRRARTSPPEADEQAAGHEGVDEPGEGPVGGGAVDLGLEEEQPDQGLQRRPARRTPEGRGGLVARQRELARRTEQVADGVEGVGRRGQRVAQRRGEVDGGYAGGGSHAAIVAPSRDSPRAGPACLLQSGHGSSAACARRRRRAARARRHPEPERGDPRRRRRDTARWRHLRPPGPAERADHLHQEHRPPVEQHDHLGRRAAAGRRDLEGAGARLVARRLGPARRQRRERLREGPRLAAERHLLAAAVRRLPRQPDPRPRVPARRQALRQRHPARAAVHPHRGRGREQPVRRRARATSCAAGSSRRSTTTPPTAASRCRRPRSSP